MNTNHFTPPPPRYGLIGHRGVAALAPENTMASFRLAAEQQISWIEFDLRLTKDDGLVIFHDDTAERTTNGKGLIHEMTLAELTQLDAGSWFNSRFQGEKIPVLTQIFPELMKLDLFFNIELKFPPSPSMNQEQLLVSQLADVLKHLWPPGRPLPLISSFHWPVLHLMRLLMPDVPLGFLSDEANNNLVDLIANTNNAALHCHIENISPPLLAYAHDRHVPVLTYTVNEANIASELLSDGVFGIFSDNPLLMINQWKG